MMCKRNIAFFSATIRCFQRNKPALTRSQPHDDGTAIVHGEESCHDHDPRDGDRVCDKCTRGWCPQRCGIRFRPSVRLSVRPSVRLSVRLSVRIAPHRLRPAAALRMSMCQDRIWLISTRHLSSNVCRANLVNPSLAVSRLDTCGRSFRSTLGEYRAPPTSCSKDGDLRPRQSHDRRRSPSSAG